MKQRIRLTESQLHNVIQESVKRILTEMEDGLEVLFTQIARKVKAKGQHKTEEYINKVYGDIDNIPEDEDGSRRVEFVKDIMVNIEGVWYRCKTMCSGDFSFSQDDGDYDTPPATVSHYAYDMHIVKITKEATKEVVYDFATNRDRRLMNLLTTHTEWAE